MDSVKTQINLRIHEVGLVSSLKLLKFKVIYSWFVNNDFPDSVLHTLEQDLGKAACQRNWNLTPSDARIRTTTQGTVIPSKTV